MIRLIPPIAVPFGVPQIASSVLAGGGGAAARFNASLARSLGRAQAAVFGSGRAALGAYLQRHASTARREVVIPAYTCWTVPASVVRAGLRPRLIDVDPMTFDLRHDELEAAVGPETVAVVAAHLLAPSADVAKASEISRALDRGVKLVEDAAQVWPAPGTPADAVLLSFGRGKPLPLGSGGAVLTDDSSPESAPPIRSGGWLAAMQLAATALLGRPGWYRIPASIPALGIGETRYEPAFEAQTPFRAWQGRLGTRLLDELPRLVAARTRNARRLSERLGELGGVTLPAPARAEGPLRLPLLVPTRETRDALLPALRRRGVSASAMYPGTIADIPALRPHLVNPGATLPGARTLAHRLLTLPVHPGLSEPEVERIAAAFERALREVAR